MKTVLLFLSLFSIAAHATEITVTSDDCNFEVRKERDSTVIRVNKIIAISNSVSSWEIDLPTDKIGLPLEEGMKLRQKNSFGEEVVVSYKNGILTHDHKASSNFTRDTLELSISTDLKHIRQARFTRKGTGLLFLMGSEKFECKF